jgi:hypothetical protein
MKRLIIFAFTLLLLAIPAFSASPEPVAQTVDALIKTVEKSDLKFVRNGDEHTAKEAAEHMRRKYDHFKKEIKTPEDFVNKCASKSELSGKPYTVKKPDGSTEKCDVWMRSLLEQRQKAADTASPK